MAKSVEYQNVTYKQISDMKHAIGFSNRKVRGTKHRKYEPYRNYFCAGERDRESWDTLVDIGLATKRGKSIYTVSADGRFFLEMVTGVAILPESD